MSRRDNTIGLELERVRLEHRSHRLDYVIDALHRIERLHEKDPAPAPLHHALMDFSREKAELKRRLAQL